MARVRYMTNFWFSASNMQKYVPKLILDWYIALCRPSTGKYIVIDIALYKNPHMLRCMSLKALQTAQSDPSYSKRFKGRPHRYAIDRIVCQILSRKIW